MWPYWLAGYVVLAIILDRVGTYAFFRLLAKRRRKCGDDATLTLSVRAVHLHARTRDGQTIDMTSGWW
jgi:hypothetical protein